MRVFTFSEARQNLATVLKLAQTEDSPLDIASVPLNLSREEIVASVRESRER